MNSKFKEFWNEYTRKHYFSTHRERNAAKEASKSAWNKALDRSKKKFKSLDVYIHDDDASIKFHRNINKLYV